MTSPFDTAALTGHQDHQNRQNRLVRFGMRGLGSVAFGTVIAFLFSGSSGTAIWPNLVLSVCISVLCWFSIDLGRISLAKWRHRFALPGTSEAESQWPGWPLMFVLIAVGTLIGFSGGNMLAGWMLGHAMPGYFRGSLHQGLALLIGSLVPGLAITYWYKSRETIAAQVAAVQTAQRQAAEHQLKLLESQLEPHMLFNTLANLRVLIGIDPPRAQAMLDQLIGFLRATLSGSRTSQHSLRAEFARLGNYLALMQVRMGERLQTSFDLPDALADTLVAPLLLQPLIENCIKHGLEPAVAGGRIDVSAAREGTELVLRVRDTGTGLCDSYNANPVDSETQTAHDTGSSRFGLVQVRERLLALYGARATLQLRPAGDGEGGTLATIRLPLTLR